MKRLIISFTIVLWAVIINAQSSDQNYIVTKTYLDETQSRSIEQIQYFDGLGRPVQTVQKGITPLGADLVTYQEYDAFGRESAAWLPIKMPGNNGAFVPLSTLIDNISGTYTNESKPYALPYYEPSPLNRVIAQTGPGQRWHTPDTSKSVRTAYLTNTEYVSDGDNSLACRLYRTTDERDVNSISISSEYVPLTTTVKNADGTTRQVPLSSGGRILTTRGTGETAYYAPGQLYVTKMTDEVGNISYEFKDKLGQVVLTRQIDPQAGMHDTYYVYDSFGNLRAVLPPIATDLITAGSALDENNQVLSDYAYLYQYDNRNRCTWKKLPGCDPVRYEYDKADRLIFSQDGEMRDKGIWMFSLPDAFGRVAVTGTTTQAPDVSGIVIKTTRSDAPGTLLGYARPEGITLPDAQVLTVNYYDDYSFRGSYGIPDNEHTRYEPLTGYGTQYEVSQKGLLTGTLTAQFTEVGVDSTYLYAVMYYDERARVVQTKSGNHLKEVQKEFIAYNFTGEPTDRRLEHRVGTPNALTEVYSYEYDHGGRLKKVMHSVDNKPAVLLAENSYDELGRMSGVKRFNVQNTSLASGYAYNVRSWVTDITGNLFKEHLEYEDGGNVELMNWTLGSNKRTYGYEYDGLSRLKVATFTGATTAEKYGTGYSYDKHGNMLTLLREGKTDTGYGVVDRLAMSYRGNQLTAVTDEGTAVTLPGSNVFEKGSTAAVQYDYNLNGAMKKDLNKKIADISYNMLNLPNKVEINGTTHKYRYAADGRKLQVRQGDGYRDYVGNVIYEDGSLTRILVDGGYVQKEGSEYKYYFYLSDHLGNNSVVAKEDGTPVQNNSYYPFGLPMAETADLEQDVQPYKYNGKEFDRKDGLNLFDYSARYMDPALGRFTSVDPIAEKYYAISPYGYCKNNPVNRIDPDGRDDYRFQSNGKIHIVKGTLNNGKPDRLLAANGNYITISDKKFLPGLTVNQGGNVGPRKYYNHTSNIEDAANVFQFASENTSIEWKIQVYTDGDETTASVSTSLRMNQVSGTEKLDENLGKKQIKAIHSHPDGGDSTEASDADKSNAAEKPESKHAIYHPSSKKIYEYDHKKIYNTVPVDENNNVFKYINDHAY